MYIGRSNEMLGWEGVETITCFAFLKCKLTAVTRACCKLTENLPTRNLSVFFFFLYNVLSTLKIE
jgi:hypothetical protein